MYSSQLHLNSQKLADSRADAILLTGGRQKGLIKILFVFTGAASEVSFNV